MRDLGAVNEIRQETFTNFIDLVKRSNELLNSDEFKDGIILPSDEPHRARYGFIIYKAGNLIKDDIYEDDHIYGLYITILALQREQQLNSFSKELFMLYREYGNKISKLLEVIAKEIANGTN